MMETLLTASEVAALLRVHQNDVYTLVKSGELRAIRVGKRRLRFSPSAVAAWLDAESNSEGHRRHDSPREEGD